MPQVASEATRHTHKATLPNPARAAQTSDRAQDSPFASLIDDGTPATNDQPPQSPPASGDNAARTILPDSAQLPAHDSRAAHSDGMVVLANGSANSAAADLAAAVTVLAGNGKVVGADKTNPDATAGEQAVAGEVAKSAADRKPSDGPALADPGTVPAGDLIPVIVPVAAAVVAAVVPQTTTDGIAQAVPAPDPKAAFVGDAQAALVGEAQAALVGGAQAAPGGAPPIGPATVAHEEPAGILQAAPALNPQPTPAAKPAKFLATETPKTKPAKLTGLPADTGKPADASDAPAETSITQKSDGKPQPASDTDKPPVSLPHETVAANSHRTAAAETPSASVTDSQAAAPKLAPDAVQQVLPALASHDLAPAAPVPPAAPAIAVPLAGIAVEIAGKALAGKNRFEIRLDPPELGRIEVRLDVSHDGHVTSSLIADRSDTLDLLRRDAAGLERALQDAGLKTSDNGLQFSLRDQNMGRDQGNAPSPGAARLVVNDDALPVADLSPRNYGRRAGLGGGIDIRV